MRDPGFAAAQLQLRREGDRIKVFDPVRRKWLVLTPEEHVRQCVLHHLVEKLSCPKGRIALERTVRIGAVSRRFDIVVFDGHQQPWLLVECKAPEVPVSEQTLHQLLHYHNRLQAAYWMLTNGHECHCADARNPAAIRWLDALPEYGAD